MFSPNRVSRQIRRVGRRGFTLVEILIVVIILGILAAIVIPQFTNASNDARKSNLSSQLQTLRAQIELYKLQHKESVPKLITGGGGMWNVFTEYTDITGAVSATGGPGTAYPYGPYYTHLPANPLAPNGTATNLVATAPDGASGWIYDEATGKIGASGTDPTKWFDETTGNDSATATW